MYAWDVAPEVEEAYAALPGVARRALDNYMDAACLVDPWEFRRTPDESPGHLRNVHFHPDGLVSFVIVVHARTATVVRITWTGKG